LARKGLNCTLSYPDAGGAVRTYRVRAGVIAHGVQMVFEESEARTARAFYPHRTAMEQFQVTVLLKNWDERGDLVNWLSTYANYAVNPNIIQSQFPWMTVVIPSRGFSQVGVPLTGYEWGAHTGQMMFTPVINFESARSPGSSLSPQVSSVINKWSAFANDPAVQYFYPFGTQLAGSQTAVTSTSTYVGSPSVYNQNPGPGLVPSNAGG
jgi:hypothetical protein